MNKINKKGVTIVEILLYIGLLSIFMITLLNVFVAGANFKLESESTATMQSDSQFIFAKLANDIPNAASVSVPGTLGAATETITFVSGGIAISYSLSGDGDLIRTSSGVSEKLNSLDTKLTSLSFRRLGNVGDPPTIQVEYTLESRIVKQGSIKETRSFQTTLGLR